jgi:hypothetical protein
MPIAGISLGTGLGGGTTATISGAPGGGGGAAVFIVGVVDTQANILARSSDDAGTIAYGTDTDNFYVFDGSLWFNYPEQQ